MGSIPVLMKRFCLRHDKLQIYVSYPMKLRIHTEVVALVQASLRDPNAWLTTTVDYRNNCRVGIMVITSARHAGNLGSIPRLCIILLMPAHGRPHPNTIQTLKVHTGVVAHVKFKKMCYTYPFVRVIPAQGQANILCIVPIVPDVPH